MIPYGEGAWQSALNVLSWKRDLSYLSWKCRLPRPFARQEVADPQGFDGKRSRSDIRMRIRSDIRMRIRSDVRALVQSARLSFVVASPRRVTRAK